MPFKSSRSFTSVLSSSNSCKFQEKVRNVEFIESEMNMEENTSNTISLSVLNKNDDYFFLDLERNDSDIAFTDIESIDTNDTASLNGIQYECNEIKNESFKVVDEYDDNSNTKMKYRSFESVNGIFETISLAVTGVRIVIDENNHQFAQYRIQGSFKGLSIDLWRRYTAFSELAIIANRENMSNTILSWDAVQCFKDFWKNLNMDYLLSKKDTLDEFLESFLYECDNTSSFTAFLNIRPSIVNQEEPITLF